MAGDDLAENLFVPRGRNGEKELDDSRSKLACPANVNAPACSLQGGTSGAWHHTVSSIQQQGGCLQHNPNPDATTNLKTDETSTYTTSFHRDYYNIRCLS